MASELCSTSERSKSGASGEAEGGGAGARARRRLEARCDPRLPAMRPWVTRPRHAPADLRSSRGGTRTPDPPVNSRLLYQLSYSGRRDVRHRTSDIRWQRDAQIWADAHGSSTDV